MDIAGYLGDLAEACERDRESGVPMEELGRRWEEDHLWDEALVDQAGDAVVQYSLGRLQAEGVAVRGGRSWNNTPSARPGDRMSRDTEVFDAQLTPLSPREQTGNYWYDVHNVRPDGGIRRAFDSEMLPRVGTGFLRQHPHTRVPWGGSYRVPARRPSSLVVNISSGAAPSRKRRRP